MARTVLLTGATGYIGSHTWVGLQAAGYAVVGVDNFSNSSPAVLDRLNALLGCVPVFVQANVCDATAIEAVFAAHRIEATVHFAADKAVGESTQQPLRYYANNVGGLLVVCDAMRRHGTSRFVFSSSATVYGQPERLPVAEGDLAEGHVAALRRLLDAPGSFTVNLGTGVGYSVLEVIKAYEQASGRPVPYDLAPRRPGDVAACYADPERASQLLGWRARRNLDAMCADSWRWQQLNPSGFSAS